ncbi:hypothetical protein I6A84_24000 [Frankia sp. CNm7]|uniref:Uncharacterized protein n=1 Tax=Frankia nepalensis TaxID=1836974 RepID=A0A937ULX9_9ACTN|nr:hypothetical protein [Frankia nepalensis]MBL7499899.1 hypothetical protein [Frankia nepalensis]MBL7512283.1 hypothetical protein [Frankia nepalensis]MBL7521067.1 hypothetical protein [Frankia nepalensis]MBL7628319.1 hypothetical protein [Frankia nepalensis]
MTKILLSLHVLAAILTVGPVAVAASMFPRYLRLAAADPADGAALATARTLYRVCRVYALVGIAVPFFGLATAGPMHVFGDAWVIASIVLTAAAAGLLAGVILPRQRRALADCLPDADAVPADVAAEAEVERAGTSAGSAGSVVVAAPVPSVASGRPDVSRLAARLAMTTGIFNLLWAVVVVLMIVRPGSTTGA